MLLFFHIEERHFSPYVGMYCLCRLLVLLCSLCKLNNTNNTNNTCQAQFKSGCSGKVFLFPLAPSFIPYLTINSHLFHPSRTVFSLPLLFMAAQSFNRSSLSDMATVNDDRDSLITAMRHVSERLVKTEIQLSSGKEPPEGNSLKISSSFIPSSDISLLGWLFLLSSCDLYTICF